MWLLELGHKCDLTFGLFMITPKFKKSSEPNNLTMWQTRLTKFIVGHQFPLSNATFLWSEWTEWNGKNTRLSPHLNGAYLSAQVFAEQLRGLSPSCPTPTCRNSHMWAHTTDPGDYKSQALGKAFSLTIAGVYGFLWLNPAVWGHTMLREEQSIWQISVLTDGEPSIRQSICFISILSNVYSQT